jgi:selenocysteine-specific elongation factor
MIGTRGSFGKPSSPSRVRDIARSTGTPESFVRRLFKLAARRGDVDEVAHDRFFLRAATGELAALARDLAAHGEQGRFNVIAFRDRIGAGRKVAIHILEYFDRQGFTMRRGDWRRINPHKANLP